MSSSRVGGTLAQATFVTAVSSNLGFTFGVIGPALRSGLGLSHAALGLLTSVFFACTGAASIAAGHLVARSGNRKTAGAALGLTSIGCVLAAVVGEYAALLAAALVAGAGYAVVNVVTNRIVRGASAPDRLGRFMAVKTAGVPLATTFVAIIGAATARWGWRPALFVLGGAAAIATAVAGRAFPTGARERVWRHARAPLPAGFTTLAVAGFCIVAGTQPLYSWFAVYLHESEGMSTWLATLISGICTAAGVPAMVAGARLSDRFGAAHRARFIAALCGLCGVVLALVLSTATIGVPAAVLAVGIGIAANLSFAGVFPALIAECAPAALERGTGVAMTGYFLGALVAPVGFGALSDAAGYPLAWGLASVLCVVAAALFMLIGRRFGNSPTGAATRPLPDGPVVA